MIVDTRGLGKDELFPVDEWEKSKKKTIGMPELIQKDIQDLIEHIEFRHLEYNMHFNQDDLEQYHKAVRINHWLKNGELNESISNNQ